MPSAITRLLIALDPIARAFGLYLAYRLSPSERIEPDTFSGSLEDARRFLRRNAYRPNYLSAAKRHPETRQGHDLSYRRVPREHPPEALERAIGQEWDPRECQYHVHVWRHNGSVEFYSHYEVRPDFLRPSIDIERLQTHYRPRHGQDYLPGVTDLSG